MKTIVQNFGEATKRIGRAVWSATSMRGVALRRKTTKNIEGALRGADPSIHGMTMDRNADHRWDAADRRGLLIR